MKEGSLRRIRLVIDARRTSSSGIGRYTFCLLEALSSWEHLAKFDIYALGPSVAGISHVTWVPFEEPLLYPWQRSSLPDLLQKIRGDVMIAPQYYIPSDLSIPVIRVLHDAHPFWDGYQSPRPEVFERVYDFSNIVEMAHRVSYRWNPTKEVGDRSVAELIQHMYKYVCDAGEKIVTVSEFSSLDLCRYVTPLGGVDFNYPYIPNSLRKDLADVGLRGRSKSTILMVAKVEPRKRHLDLISAVDKVRLDTGRDLQLVLIGGDTASFPEYAARVRELASTHAWVENPGQVSDETLAAWLKRAGLVVFPSMSEGFGFPALEAMETGAPLLAAAGTSLPEICGDAAYFFDEYRVSLEVAVLNALAHMESESEVDVLRRKQRAESFSLPSFAQGWSKFIEEVL